MMTDFISRLELERSDLADKLHKLGTFIQNKGLFDALPKIHQDLLREQFEAMIKYIDVLERRLELLGIVLNTTCTS
jgi:hypothetical protein